MKLCVAFHGQAEVAATTRSLAARKPTLKRGRPATVKVKRVARLAKRLQQKIADLFEHRYLFVQHDLTLAERRTLRQITRGLAQLRTLRDIMEEGYRLFDRRCRTDTALAKLAKLRRRVRRFKAGRQGSEQTSIRQPGQGPDVPRRQTVSVNLERCRAGQPSPPQDAEDCLQRSHPGAHPQPHRLGHAP